MTTDKECRCQEKHHSHLCVLRSKGLFKEIELLTNNPSVTCCICGAEANSEDDVCFPEGEKSYV